MSFSQCGNRFEYDVLVIGAGAAGLSFILELLKQKPNIKIALISKTKAEHSNSAYAQGGIAAANSGEASIDEHYRDTQQAGDESCHPQVVNDILSQGQSTISFLQEHGVEFNQDANGEMALAQEGGHSCRRIYHYFDQTGKAIIGTLLAQVMQHPQVSIFEFHIAVNLIQSRELQKPGVANQILGAFVLDEAQNLIHSFFANVTVLATGGAGKVFRYTSNPDVATGDGIAMAFRAGARIANMQYYQFHPTLLYSKGENNFLISEAVRGEGALLRLPGTGERFMQKYDPERLELSTRDIVTRAIFSEIERGDSKFVHLDITHKDKEYLQQRFPNITQTLLELGIDMSKEPIPVIPAAHYLCGGILSDVDGNTDLPRLFAVGETAYTGLHGANRLASNSLLEAIVVGRNAANASQSFIDKAHDLADTITDWESDSVTDLRRASQISSHWRGLRSEMTSYAGVIRTEAGLRDLLALIRVRSNMIEEYYWNYMITRDLIELRNSALVDELIVRSSLCCRESRGCHYREDYPERALEQSDTILQFNDLYQAIYT